MGAEFNTTKSGDARPVIFFESDAIKPYVIIDLAVVLKSPIKFRPPYGAALHMVIQRPLLLI